MNEFRKFKKVIKKRRKDESRKRKRVMMIHIFRTKIQVRSSRSSSHK